MIKYNESIVPTIISLILMLKEEQKRSCVGTNIPVGKSVLVEVGVCV